jgi:hypothetical protein
MKKVSKKTAYDIKEASNPKLKASARKNYAKNAEAAMKDKKSPAKQIAKPAPKASAMEGKAAMEAKAKAPAMMKKSAAMMKKAPASKMKKC